jgi:CRISPR/Cas system-associated exonuclease Cas4 (RecB family)
MDVKKRQNFNRTRGLFNSESKEPFRLSRSKIDLFFECPRCFYMDRRLGIGRPSGPPFTLNSAVDALLKKEFDIHRAKNQAHPLMEHYKIAAIPFQHPKMDEWRNTFKGVQFLHAPTNFYVFGAVDDIWINAEKELHVVDYKATSTANEITLDDKWKQAYKRQMEVYQWLLRGNDFKVSDEGFFVYANAKKDRAAFDGKLEFDIQIISYKGNSNWVEDTLIKARQCLDSQTLPKSGPECGFCRYREAAKKVEKI